MATPQRTTGLTYDDLQGFPDDNLRREIIDGELFVTPAPATRHQRAVRELTIALGLYCREHGGEMFPAPTDVFFSKTNVVEPDAVLLTAESTGKLADPRYIGGAPDLVVEVSSPGTRRIDLTRKKDLYERFGVREYWFVDLDADRIDAYRLEGDRFGEVSSSGRGATLRTPLLPGLAVPVDDLLGRQDER
jgi:Uma2 family endonuclease